MKNKSYKINIWMQAIESYVYLPVKVKIFSILFLISHYFRIHDFCNENLIFIKFCLYLANVSNHILLWDSLSLSIFFPLFFVFNIWMGVSGNKTTTLASPLSHSIKHSVIFWRGLQGTPSLSSECIQFSWSVTASK